MQATAPRAPATAGGRMPVRFAWRVDAGDGFVRSPVAYGATRKGKRPAVGRLARRC